MKRLPFYLAAFLVLTLAGCQELAVENENSPNRLQALAEPGDVEGLVSQTFTGNWQRQWCGMANTLTTMADANSASWANWGMRDMSSEPRIAWPNDPSYRYASANSGEWFTAYGTISDANDGLFAVRAAEEAGSVDSNTFTAAGVDTGRLKAFAKFNQAWAHSWLALIYDRAFIVDENVDLEAVARGDVQLELSPYSDVMAAAVAMMDEAIALAQANTFTITAAEDWIFGLDMTNDDLVLLGNTLKAKWLAYVGRTPAERDGADWNAINNLIDAGIAGDFTPVGDDNGDIREWDCLKWATQEGGIWARMDYKHVGTADESGGYENWLATPLLDRVVFDIFTTDRRIVGGDGVDPTVDGLYTQYQGTNGPWPPSRGTYHYASHNHKRFQAYRDAGSNGPMPYILRAELDLLKAEALLRTGGSLDDVANLINTTRVANGQLNAASAADGAGASSDEQDHLDAGSLWAKLKHEKRMETLSTSAGLQFFDDRGWGDLTSNTPLQFPIPGAELETLQLQIYTFGGGGDSSAPKAAGETYGPSATPDRSFSVE